MNEFCAYCGIDKKSIRNNHCLVDIKELHPSMAKYFTNAIKAINPVHFFVNKTSEIVPFYGISE